MDENDLKIKERLILGIMKNFGPIRGERNLFSLTYLAQKFADGSMPNKISFCIDIFGISSNEMRNILDKLERKGKIRIMPSNELDPELLVSKYNIYSINGQTGREDFSQETLEIIERLTPLHNMGCRNLATVVYLYESTKDWAEATKIGKRLGLRDEDILEGLGCMKQISSY